MDKDNDDFGADLEHTEFYLTQSQLLKRIDFDPHKQKSKISIIGLNKLGLAIAMDLTMIDYLHEICLVGKDKDLAKLFANDLNHSTYFAKGLTHVTYCNDFSLAANSDICIIAEQICYQSTDENLLNYAEKNTQLYKEIIPKLMENNSNTILIVATEPNNIMSYVAWRLSKLPRSRVFGIGTVTESHKFQYLIGKQFDISPTICNGWIIGDKCENGGIPVWDSISFGTVKLIDIVPDIETNNCNNIKQLYKIPDKIIQNNLTIKKYKNSFEWSVAISIGRIVKAILHNSMIVDTVSCYAGGYLNIEENVYLALPCVIGSVGCISIIQQKLKSNDVEKLKTMAKSIADIQLNIILVNSY